jgi:hypothetical protein
MVRTKRFFLYRQRLLEERLGVGVTTLLTVERSQVVQRRSDVGVIGTKRFFLYRQRLLEERFGVGVTTLIKIEIS